MSDASILFPEAQYIYVDDGPTFDDPAAPQFQFSGSADADYVIHFDAPPQELADGDVIFTGAASYGGATIPGGGSATISGGGGDSAVVSATVSTTTGTLLGGPAGTASAATGAPAPGVPSTGGASLPVGTPIGTQQGQTVTGGGVATPGEHYQQEGNAGNGLSPGDYFDAASFLGGRAGGAHIESDDHSHDGSGGLSGSLFSISQSLQVGSGGAQDGAPLSVLAVASDGASASPVSLFGNGGVTGFDSLLYEPSSVVVDLFGSGLDGGFGGGFGGGISAAEQSPLELFSPSPVPSAQTEQAWQTLEAVAHRPIDLAPVTPAQTSGGTLDLADHNAAQYVDLDPASGGAAPRDAAYYETAANHANAGTNQDDPAQVHAVAASVENIVGTAYADVIHGDSAANDISAGGGDDSILGSAGNDTIHGGGGHNTLDYGAFDNDHPLTVTGANDGAGTVSFHGGTQTFTGVTTIIGGAGNDAIDLHTWTQPAHIIGGPGDDVLRGGAGSDTIEGGTGDDTIRGSFGDDAIHGDAGHNTLDYGAFDSAHPMVVTGSTDGAGSMSVDGPESIHQTFTGITTLIGGDGGDRINLGTWSSAAHVAGGAGNDTITGGAGGDSLEGGAGDDTFHLSAGADTIIGGAGDNTIDCSAFENGSVSITGSADGAGHIVVGHDTQTFNGIGTFIGTTVNDTIDLHAWSQAACIDGGGGSGDSLTGGSGNDTLVAGDAATLTGGAGADVFHFRSAPGSPAVIDDFSHGVDKLAFLTTGGFSGLGGQWSFATVNDGSSHSGSAATATLTYDTSNHTLYYDADGTGGGAATALAVIQNHATVDASDIVVTNVDVAIHG